MKYRTIRNAAVLGAGVMGSQIAAHLANAGVPVLLLDITPDGTETRQERNSLATQAVRNLSRLNPAPLMTTDAADLISTGNLDDDFEQLANVDLILECVVEQLDVKTSLWRRIGKVASAKSILGTGTSGLSCTAMSTELPSELQPGFMGIHFFNPPRYMKLVEIVPTSTTGEEALEEMSLFVSKRLGKSVVICNDTPNFIANRIGVFSLMSTLMTMEKLGLSVSEVDAITGPALGRPRSATFRTLDLVGLDTFAEVANNTRRSTTDQREADLLQLPDYVNEMLERGWLGEKAGQGFYKRVRGSDGSIILALDLESMEYAEREEVSFPSLAEANKIANTGERIRSLIYAGDPAGQLAWQSLSQTLIFTASKADEIANRQLVAIDQAMRDGFNWELGPFEIWNAIGVQESISRMEQDGLPVPNWVKKLEQFPVANETAYSRIIHTRASQSASIVRTSTSTTLIDLGDDVLGLEFHPPNQAIDQQLLDDTRAAAEETEENWRGLVVFSNATNFCVGANLHLVLQAARESRWESIDQLALQLQTSNMMFKYLARPVVIAVSGMALGGGAEIVMHGDRAVAAAESYIGLVEIGVGLVPAGGGVKEMAIRAGDHLPSVQSLMPNRPELINFLAIPFEHIGTAKISGSAAEARALDYLRETDQIVMNASQVLSSARELVLDLDRAGYQPPVQRNISVAGPEGRAVLDLVAYTFRNWGLATDHDQTIVQKLAYVLTGGELPAGTVVPEDYLLELEREAFLSLCGMEKTQARMEHMLATGKPLRN